MTDVTSLDALEALLAKATPGEWEFQTCPFDNYSYTLSAPAAKGNYSHVIADICLRDPAKANAALIVALRNAAPDLIAKARRVEELEAALGEICRDSNPDWTEKRVYPNDVLDDIHTIAVNAYYKVTT